jgi:tRNA(Ile)-lysidine synthase
MDLLERVDRALPSGRFAVACSGGADSIALLHLAVELGRDVAAFHIDHQLRADSHADATFVEDACLRLGVPFDATRVSVPAGPSIEAAARDVRYAALEELARGSGIDAVATAHTLDDQAETVLLRATRGGSLAGITPRRGIFIRPLLAIRRGELRSWLVAEGIAWREDPTNDDLTLERNWTRHVLLPQLRERRAGVAHVLARLAARSAEDDALLRRIASDEFARAEIDDNGVRLRGATDLPRAILRRVVWMAFRELGVAATEGDVQALLDAWRVRTRGVEAWLDTDLVVVRDPVPQPLALRLREGVIDAPAWGVRLRVSDGSDPAWRWRTFASSDELVVRSREPGDRVRTSGGTKKVHDVLVDAKIPRALRDLVPVVAGEESLAVVGLTRSPERSTVVLDAEPLDATWSRKVVWTSR